MNYGKTEVKRQKVDRFLEFFYQLGYDRRTERKLTGNIGLATFYSREKIYKRTISCMNGAESSFEPMNIQTFWLVLRSYEVRVNVLYYVFWNNCNLACRARGYDATATIGLQLRFTFGWRQCKFLHTMPSVNDPKNNSELFWSNDRSTLLVLGLLLSDQMSFILKYFLYDRLLEALGLNAYNTILAFVWVIPKATETVWQSVWSQMCQCDTRKSHLLDVCLLSPEQHFRIKMGRRW